MEVELSQGAEPQSDDVLSTLPVIVGRALDADLCLDDPDVSLYHCLIDQINGTLFVTDLVSRHGTLVNGRRIDESPLLPGDELTLGSTSLFIQYERASTFASPGGRVHALGCKR